MENKENIKKEKNLDNIKEVEMAKKSGLFGLVSVKIQRRYLNPIGFALLVIGVYFLLVLFDAIPFTPRFEFFEDSRNIFWTSIISVISGVILNDRIRNIFRR